jgi:hypothetical protein
MKYALIIDSFVRDVCTDPFELFHPSVASQFVQVPDIVQNGWWYSGTEYLEFVPVPEAAPVIPLPPDNRITRLAFRNRFTVTEKMTLELAGLDNPAATIAERTNAAALRINQADLAAATFIDLDREDTRNGVLSLETVGLLAADRALEILDTPVTELEKFVG